METTAETTAPDPLPPGEASPPPLGLLIVVWMGAFSVLLWTMMFLFRARLRPAPEPEAGDGDEP